MTRLQGFTVDASTSECTDFSCGAAWVQIFSPEDDPDYVRFYLNVAFGVLVVHMPKEPYYQVFPLATIDDEPLFSTRSREFLLDWIDTNRQCTIPSEDSCVHFEAAEAYLDALTVGQTAKELLERAVSVLEDDLGDENTALINGIRLWLTDNSPVQDETEAKVRSILHKEGSVVATEDVNELAKVISEELRHPLNDVAPDDDSPDAVLLQVDWYLNELGLTVLERDHINQLCVLHITAEDLHTLLPLYEAKEAYDRNWKGITDWKALIQRAIPMIEASAFVHERRGWLKDAKSLLAGLTA